MINKKNPIQIKMIAFKEIPNITSSGFNGSGSKLAETPSAAYLLGAREIVPKWISNVAVNCLRKASPSTME